MKIKTKKIFYLYYAKLECKVIVNSGEWSKYFNKLYSNSQFLTYSDRKIASIQSAILNITSVPSENPFIKFRAEKGYKIFYIDAADVPIFLFPSVHQFVARIFNILFHFSGGFVLHSSSILVNNEAILFVGESGRGKSTIVDKMKEFNTNYYILADNSAFVKKLNGKFMMYPSPFIEPNRISLLHTKVPTDPPYKVSAVFFPSHANRNRVSNLSFDNRLNLIKRNTHIPYKSEKLFNHKQLVVFSREIFSFVDSVNMYSLEFTVTNNKFTHFILGKKNEK